MGFSKAELERFRDATVPDLVGEDCRLLFVGINPGLWTAATQTHFCHPSNRFYPALLKAGLVDWTVESDTGMTDDQRADFVGRGMGITNLIARATVRASELSANELRSGAGQLTRRVEIIRPRLAAIAGISTYRTAFKRPKTSLGPQTEQIAGSELWVVPNPSGLNAHETIDSLSEWYGEAAEAAGVL